MEIQEKLLTVSPYSRPETKRRKTTKIVVHYVGNPASTALNNRNYFENLRITRTTKASAHYIIGLMGEIIRCVPDDEIAYTSNAANAYSIGIECCHPTSDGHFTAATINSLKDLLRSLCDKYGLNPTSDIIRHYDVTKKLCPKWYVEHPDEWEILKEEVQEMKRYEKLADVPTWAQVTVKKLIDKALLKGDEKGSLNLSEDMVRMLVINDRAGLYR